MYRPRKKGWSLLPRAIEGRSSGSIPSNPRDDSGMILGGVNGKGKGIAVAEALPPPLQASLGDDKGAELAGECGEEEVWRSFREAGFLDESVLQKRNCEAFAERISELEKELYDYQYNMGLLLIEKKEWASNYEEIRRRLAEIEETLMHERAAHRIARSELERQDENKRKALVVEKQSVVDVEIQKLLADRNMILDSKKQDSELEMETKRNIFDQVVKDRLDAVEMKTAEINNREVQSFNKEQDLEIELQKLKEKEKKFDKMLDALKEREDSIREDENKLKDVKEKLLRDTQKLVTAQTELENSRAAMEAERMQSIREKENLEEAYLQLQSKLEQEIGDYRIMKESHKKEVEELQQERGRLEKESEVLDKRKLAFETELNQFNAKKERFEKWRYIEEEKLKKERLETTIRIQRELEELRLIKEAFGNSLVHQLDPGELFKKHADIKDADELKIQKLKPDQGWLQGNKENSVCKSKLEAEQLDIQKDISTLRLISKNLRNQQEVLIKEREHIFALAEQFKCCKNCGFKIDDSEAHGIQISKGTVGSENIPRSSLADKNLKEPMEGENTDVSQDTCPQHDSLGDHMPLLQKCSSLFSHKKMTNQSSDGYIEKSPPFDAHLDAEASEEDAKFKSAPSFRVANTSVDMQRAPSVGVWYNEELKGQGKANEAEPAIGVADFSSEMTNFQSDHGAMEPNFPSVREQNGKEGSFLLPETNSQVQLLKQRQHRPSSSARSKTIKGTHSVNEVVEVARSITVVNSEEKHNEQSNGEDKYSQQVHEEGLKDPVQDDHMASNAEQNIHFSDASGLTNSELDAEDGEVHSERVSHRGHRKRQQTSPATETTGSKRYNLRRSTIVATMTATQRFSYQSKGQKKGSP